MPQQWCDESIMQLARILDKHSAMFCTGSHKPSFPEDYTPASLCSMTPQGLTRSSHCDEQSPLLQP